MAVWLSGCRALVPLYFSPVFSAFLPLCLSTLQYVVSLSIPYAQLSIHRFSANFANKTEDTNWSSERKAHSIRGLTCKKQRQRGWKAESWMLEERMARKREGYAKHWKQTETDAEDRVTKRNVTRRRSCEAADEDETEWRWGLKWNCRARLSFVGLWGFARLILSEAVSHSVGLHMSVCLYVCMSL